MGVAGLQDRRGRTPTVWTRRLQVLTAVCAVVFTIGTILNGLVMTPDVIAHSQRLAGVSAAGAANTTMWFYTAAGVVVGFMFIIGNALGVLALRGWNWVFWLAIAINLIQGMGMVNAVLSPELLQAAAYKHGPAGVLPYLVTDGGGLVLAVILIASLVWFRTPWARHRAPQRSTNIH